MIDLYSDTATRPTQAMRRAIAEAEVGDEQCDGDPTTRRLEERCAQRLGKDCGVFLPSATMANAIAIQLHCQVGEELLAAENSHVLCYEVGGAAAHARASARGIPVSTGIFGKQEVAERLRMESLHSPVVRLVVVENTTNQGGGLPWPQAQLEEITAFCSSTRLRLHLDGSRLFNAAVATGQTVEQLARGFDSVTLCFSKGLGSPLGALLAVSSQEYQRARRLKQLMGGALRQSGMMAAACLHGLDHHVDRLSEDHRRAAWLAEALSEVKPLEVEQVSARTNMVFFQLPERYSSDSFEASLKLSGVSVSRMGRQRFRAATHLGLSDKNIEQAIAAFSTVCQSLQPMR